MIGRWRSKPQVVGSRLASAFSFSHVDVVFKLIHQISQRGDVKHQVGKALAFKTIGLFPSSDVGDAFQAYTC